MYPRFRLNLYSQVSYENCEHVLILKHVGEDLGSVYDGATLILEGVVKSGGMVSDVRNKLWDMLSKYYLTCAYKRNSKLMIGMANKLSDVISETI